VRELLWTLLTVAVAGMASGLVQWLGVGLVLQPLRRATPGQWTERARLAWPPIRVLAWGQVIQPAVWAGLVGAEAEGIVGAVSSWLEAVVALGAFAGASLVSHRIETQVRQLQLSYSDWLRGWVVQVVLFLMPWGMLVLVLWQGPSSVDWVGSMLLLACIGAVWVWGIGGVVVLGKWLGLLHPAPARLQTILQTAAQRLGLPPPRGYLLRWWMANALAFPLNRAVAVTDRALASFPDDELLGICLHEVAHLTEPRHIHLMRLATQFVWVPLALVAPLSEAAYWSGAVGVLALFVAGLHLSRVLYWKMELRADTLARAHESQPGSYMRALERLHELDLIPVVIRGRTLTHPNLYDRLRAAGVSPDYPRPTAPAVWPGRVSVLAIFFGAVVLGIAWLAVARVAFGLRP